MPYNQLFNIPQFMYRPVQTTGFILTILFGN